MCVCVCPHASKQVCVCESRGAAPAHSPGERKSVRVREKEYHTAGCWNGCFNGHPSLPVLLFLSFRRDCTSLRWRQWHIAIYCLIVFARFY